jgi:hypothetical protein
MIDTEIFHRWWTMLGDRFGRVFEPETTLALYELASERMTTEQFVVGARACLAASTFFPSIEELAAAAKPARPLEVAQLDEARRRRAEAEQLTLEAEWRRERSLAFDRWAAANGAEYAQMSADAWLSLYEHRVAGGELRQAPIESTPFTRMPWRARLDQLLTARLQWADCDTWIRRRYRDRRAS